MRKLSFCALLRTVLAVISFTNFAATIQCFTDATVFITKIYPNTKAPDLVSRLSGIWNIGLSTLRFSCALDIHNKSLYHLTLVSFVMTLLHFTLEIVVYKTTYLTPGVLSQLVISGIASVGMFIGYWNISRETTAQEIDEFKDFKRRAKMKKES